MTARNRELVNLVVVGILTGLGFASVYIARQSVISAGSISYALIFLGLYLVAHAVARVTVPWADPYLLPADRAADRRRADRDLPARARATRSGRASGSSSASASSRSRWSPCAPTSACSRATSTCSGSRRSGC